ncbi:hypothetical protein D3C72_1381790 [compost metagenome]
MTTHDPEHFFQAVPAAREKALIDMVNCLDVADDHLRVSATSQKGFLGRVIGLFSGETQQRQHAISQNQQTTLRQMLDVTNVLSREVAYGHNTLAKVSDRVTLLERSLAGMANAVADQRAALRDFSGQVRQNLLRVDDALGRLDMHAAARDQLDHIFSLWGAGQWDGYAMAARCYVALNELDHGVFGEYCRRFQDERSRNLRTLAVAKTAERLRHDAGVPLDEPVSLERWLAPIAAETRRGDGEALAWLGDQARLTGKAPILYLSTQWQVLPRAPELPPTVPRIPSARRLAGMMDTAFFGGLERKAEHG